jgi:beta-glucanase (GH16 family)
MKTIFLEDFRNYGRKELNREIWNEEVGGHGFGNHELQYYTSDFQNCVLKSDGLHLCCRKEKKEKNHYTSARINTAHKFSFCYGTIEFSCKLPKSLGTWPAVWMMSDQILNHTPWPKCGEIDLLEHIGRLPDEAHFSLHCETNNNMLNNHLTFWTNIPALTSDFHTYKIVWKETGFTYFVDGIKVGSHNVPTNNNCHNWPYDQNYFFIINLAMGGYWPKDPAKDFSQEDFIIQYLKVTKE